MQVLTDSVQSQNERNVMKTGKSEVLAKITWKQLPVAIVTLAY